MHPFLPLPNAIFTEGAVIGQSLSAIRRAGYRAGRFIFFARGERGPISIPDGAATYYVARGDDSRCRQRDARAAGDAWNGKDLLPHRTVFHQALPLFFAPIPKIPACASRGPVL